LLLAFASALPVLNPQALMAQQRTAPAAHFQTAHTIPFEPAGKAAESLSPRPLAMASADWDEDGVEDLAIGYGLDQRGAIALMRGNLDALAPQSYQSWLAAGHGQYASPFLPSADLIQVPEQPAMMTVADVNGDGHKDLVFAARNGHVLHVLLGDGKGHFSLQDPVTVAGEITALAAYKAGDDRIADVVIAGVKTNAGFAAQLFRNSGLGLKLQAAYPMPGSVAQIEIANLGVSFVSDAAMVAGSQLVVLHGDYALAGTARLETLPVSGVVAVAAGEYLFDRHAQMQLSVLTSDGDIHLLAHEGLDSRSYTHEEIASARRESHGHSGTLTLALRAGNTGDRPWIEVERVSGVAPSGLPAGEPVLIRSRSSGGEDAVVLNPGQREAVSIHHPGNLAAHLSSGQASLLHSPFGSSDVVAALSLRVSPLGAEGLVVLRRGSPSPEIHTPAQGNVMYVTVQGDNNPLANPDPNDPVRCAAASVERCTLRDAVEFANLDNAVNIAGGTVDTIMVPAGTYDLALSAGTINSIGNAITHIDILGPMTIIGVAGSTIIDAQSNDKIFSIDPNLNSAFNTSLVNLTLQNGQNINNPVNANAASPDNFGGALDWEAFGTGNLTITSCTIQNNTALWGPGGGIFASNTLGGAGLLTITNSTISNNSTAEEGGGVDLGFGAAAAIGNTTFSGNIAETTVNGGLDPGAVGQGGGLFLAQRGTSATPQSTITGGTFLSNTSDSDGGGLYTNTGVAISGGTTFANNASTGGSGGGIFHDSANGGFAETTTIGGATFAANSAAITGGGIAVGTGTAASGNLLTIANSRIFSNTSAGGTNGLSVGEPGTTGAGGVTAIENWWGCNGGPVAAAPNCDQALLYDASTGALATSPNIVLALTVSPNPVLANQPLQLLATVNKNSSGGTVPNSPGALAGLTIPFAVDSTGFTDSPTASIDNSGNATQTVTPTAKGSGTATASLDNQIVSVNFTVGSAPAAPTFAPPAGVYQAAQMVVIGDANPGTTIYFTTDGSTPTAASSVVSGPVTVGVSETLKAIAIESGFSNSAVASASYVIQTPAATPVLSLPAGTYTTTQLLTITDTTPNAAIYYTTDGSTPTSASKQYLQPFGFSTSETITAIAYAPGFTPSAVASAAYVFNLSPAPTPTFSPVAGTYTAALSVKIGDTAGGAAIYYTVNGATPTTASTLYTAAIPVTATETIKAIATVSGHPTSAIGSAHYVINYPAAAPVLSPAPGTYTTPLLMTITESTHNAAIYYTTDGSVPTSASKQYVQPFGFSTTETIKAIAYAPNFSPSAVASGTYIINLPPAATPTFTPAAGTYTSAQNVKLADTTGAATIYYTTDGSAPTTSSTKYTTAIAIAATGTVKAIAVASAHSTSAVGSAHYVIDYPAATPVLSVPPGTYTTPQSMTISETTSNAAIYYTTDGSAPTSASKQYLQPFGFSASETIKAIAYAPNFSPSAVASGAYIFNLPPAATPAFSPIAGTYSGAQSVKITDTTAGATMYYTTDGSAPTTSSTKYTGAISVTASETINAIAVASGHTNSPVATATFTID
jgi:hypothetical protein